MKKQINLILGILIIISLISPGSCLTINSVSSNPEEVAPGKSLTLTIELKNNLDDDAKDVEVALDLSDIPIAPETSAEIYDDEIQEGRKRDFEFDLIIDSDAEAGTYKIPIIINYEVDGKEKTKTSTVAIIVNSKPNLILSSESILLKQSKNNLDITITNTGLAKAKFLEIEINTDFQSYELLSSKNIYIGDLDSDDFDTAGFEIYVKDKDPLTISVTLKYRDSANKLYVESKHLIVKTYSTDEAARLGLINKQNYWIYIVPVFLIIVWFIYRKIRKARKNKKQR